MAYTDNIIPTMTSDTSPSGVASASSESQYAAWHAFNHTVTNVSDDRWRYFPPTWLQYQFVSAKTITQYKLTTEGYATGYPPKTWTFKGSNDGTSWTTLDTQTNITSWAAQSAQTLSFTFANTTAYTYYRLDISASNAEGGWASVGELEMMETEGGSDTAWSLATNIKGPAGAKGDTGDTGAAGVAPTGAEMMWPVATPPTGWLIEDGSSQLIASYPDLSALIRGTYGGVDGTHFNLPDGRGVVPVGYKSGDANFGTLGGTGGERTHLLTAAESGLPAHSHAIGAVVYGVGGGPAYQMQVIPNNPRTDMIVANAAAAAASAHNNLPPYRVRQFVIKT